MKKLIFFIIFRVVIFGCSRQLSQFPGLVIWYDSPAQDWMKEALPVGNGYMGVMFFGDPHREQLQFSEGSLWAGGPGSGTEYNFGIRENAASQLPAIRERLQKGDAEKAFELTGQWLSGIIHPREGLGFGDYGAQQTMGDLFVNVENQGEISDYRRELNLNTGRGQVSYTSGEVNHTRTFFGAYPLRTMVYHFENDSSVLPAIPDEWSSGKVSGLKARGGFEVDFVWKNAQVKKLEIKGNQGAKGIIKVNGCERAFEIAASGVFRF